MQIFRQLQRLSWSAQSFQNPVRGNNQLKIWSEYENKNYIVDYFKEDYFDFKVDQFDRKKHLEVMCRTVMAKNYVFCLNLILK